MKKIISFLVAFAMLICTFGAPVGAKEPEAKNANIDFLKNIGILSSESIDGSEALSHVRKSRGCTGLPSGIDAADFQVHFRIQRAIFLFNVGLSSDDEHLSG